MKRKRAILAVCVSALCLAGWLGIRAVIRSQIQSALQSGSAGNLVAREVDVGWSTSVISGVTWRDGDDSKNTWLRVKRVEIDVGIWPVMCGQRTPQHVTLIEPQTECRLDADGRLLTKIKWKSSGEQAALPTVVVKSGMLVVTQQDRRFEAKEVAGELHIKAGRPVVTGRVQSTDLGAWKVSAGIAQDLQSAKVTLSCEKQRLDSKQLRRMPLIHRWIPQALSFSGQSTAEITLAFADVQAVQVDSVFHVIDASVDVRSTDQSLHVSHVVGRLEINNRRARLSDFSGTVLDASVDVSGTLPFQRDAAAELEVRVQRLPARTLARRDSVNGTISFSADVNYVRSNTGHDITANASGHWDDAIFGRKSPGRIPLEWSGRVRLPRGEQPVVDGLLKVSRVNFGDVAITDFVLPHRFEQGALQANGIQGGVVTTHDPANSLGRFQANATVSDQVERRLQIGLELQDVEPHRVLTLIGGRPQVLLGTASATLDCDVPLSRLGDLTAWNIAGKVFGRSVEFQSLKSTELAADLALESGQLTLANGSLKLIEGGAGTFQLQSDLTQAGYPINAQINVTRVARESVAMFVPANLKATSESQAVKSAEGKFRFSFKPVAWSGAGTIDCGSISYRGVEASKVTSNWTVAPEQLRLDKLRLLIGEGEVSGTMTVPFAPDHSGSSELNLKNIDISNIADEWTERPMHATGKANGTATFTVSRSHGRPAAVAGRVVLSSPVARVTQTDISAVATVAKNAEQNAGTRTLFAGRVDEVSADFTYDITASKLTASGKLQLAELTVPIRSSVAKATWRIDKDTLHISEFTSGSDDETTLAGSVTIPLRPAATGDVSIGFKGLDVSPWLPETAAARLSIESKLDGTVQGKVGSREGRASRKIDGQIKLDSAQLVIESVPVAVSDVSVNLDGEHLQIGADGKLLQGDLSASASLKTDMGRERFQLHSLLLEEGSFKLSDGKLDLAAEQLGLPRAKRKLRGTFDFDVQATRKPDGQLLMTGELKVPEASWNDAELFRKGSASATWSDGMIRLTQLQSTLGGGVLSGNASFRPQPPYSAKVHFGLVRADLKQLLGPWPELAAQAEGTVSATINGQVGRTGTGSGSLQLTRAKFGSMAVVRADLPLLWTVDQASAAGTVRVRRGTFDFDQGRATASLRYDLGGRRQLSGVVQLQGASVKDAVRTLGRRGDTASGSITGRIDFSTRSPGDLQELTAKANVTIDWKKTPQVLLIRRILRAVVGNQSSSPTSLKRADLRARLDRGTVFVDRLELTGKSIQVVVLGTATVRGRLNLRVIADTGQVARLLDLGLLTAGTSAKQRQNYGVLAAQLVQLHVTGTMSSPVIRAEPLPQLTPGILQSFLPVSN